MSSVVASYSLDGPACNDLTRTSTVSVCPPADLALDRSSHPPISSFTIVIYLHSPPSPSVMPHFLEFCLRHIVSLSTQSVSQCLVETGRINIASRRVWKHFPFTCVSICILLFMCVCVCMSRAHTHLSSSFTCHLLALHIHLTYNNTN